MAEMNADEEHSKIRVVLVDDHSVVREGVRMILENDKEIHVAGETGDIDAAVTLVESQQPDVVLLDLAFGLENSIDTIPQIMEAAPSARILVLTGVSDQELHKRALLKGAHGLLMKDKAGAVLRTAIKKVHAGEAWVDRSLTATVLRAAAKDDQVRRILADRVRSLTVREGEIVDLIAAGHSNQSIADSLCISEKTVRNRLTVIFDKLEVTSRLELAIFASSNRPSR
ncbi:MAG: response regulator transcription factor [Pyrinomonadaceae bacterium]